VTSYFIYYRVAAGCEQPAREQVHRLQERLAATSSVRGRLMTKRGEPDLWLEIYEEVVDVAGFERALDATVRELRFSDLLAPESRRHLECFEG